MILEIKCPVCRKVNTESVCIRCSCDLSSLFDIIKISNNKISLGIKCLIEKDTSQANQYALQSWKLKKTKDAVLLGFSACCMSKNFEMANKWLKLWELIK